MTHARLIGLVVALGATPAIAQPNSSQHPRIGKLAEIPFATGSAELQLTDNKLGEVAGWAVDNPGGFIVLDGNADRRGSSTVNIRLSLRRAQAVRERLVLLGVDPDQIVIAAYGETGTRNRNVVVYATRSSLKTIVARSMALGTAAMWSGAMAPAEQPAIIATREQERRKP
jgi:hypothetical protein